MLFLRDRFVKNLPITERDRSRRFVIFGKLCSLMESLSYQKEFIYPFVTQGVFKLSRTHLSSEIGYLSKFKNLSRERDNWLLQGWSGFVPYFKQKALSTSRELGFT